MEPSLRTAEYATAHAYDVSVRKLRTFAFGSRFPVLKRYTRRPLACPAGYASAQLSLLLCLRHLRKRNRQGSSAQGLDECWVLCIETAHGFDDRRIRGLSMSSKLLDRFVASGNVAAGYSILFAICGSAYLIAFAVNHLLAPRFEPVEISTPG